MSPEEEKYYVAGGMEHYGGSFFKLIGAALRHADARNQAIVKASWPEEWATYLEMGQELDKQGVL